MYVPPYRVIARALGLTDQETEGAHGWVSDRFLRFLMEKIVAQLPFDEEAYLNANPDVADAINRGDGSPAHEHFIRFGYFEEREGAGPKFDEAYYLKTNKDVAAAVKAGEWGSGFAHYRREGAFEWRSPSAAAEQEVHRWRDMLTTASLPEMVRAA